jgi:DNA-binding SARP family transcriptional activator
MDFRILGTLEAVEGGRTVPLGPPQQRAVLALLLLYPDTVVSTERLVDALWEERPPASAPKIVQNYVWQLRKALGEHLIATRGAAYVLHLEPGQTDAGRFEDLLESGRRALADDDPAAALHVLQQALALWRGPPLDDLPALQTLQPEIAKLEELRLAAVEERFEAALLLGRHEDVIPEARASVAANPLRERLRGQLMLALYRAGRQAEALQAYRDLRAALAEELGLEPSRDLQNLEAAILRRDPDLDLQGRPAGGAPRTERGRRARALMVVLGGVAAVAALITVGIVVTADSGAAEREPTATGEATNRPAVAPGPGPPTSHAPAVGANSVVALDPRSLRVVASVPVGATPGELVSAHGSLWVVNSEDTTVSRVDPAAMVTARTIAVSERPYAIAADARSVWVVSRPAVRSARLLRIDPALDAVVETRPAPGLLSYGSGGSKLAGGRGALWLVDPAAQPRAYRIDPAGRQKDREVGIGSTTHVQTAAITVTAEGVWIASAGSVSLVEPETVTVVRRGALSQTGGPSGLASDGRWLWLVSRPGFRCCPIRAIGVGTLARIDPRTGQVTATTTIPGVPVALAVGMESVWVANQAGTVFRVDPSSGRVERRTSLGRPAGGIAVAEGAVWVSAQD